MAERPKLPSSPVRLPGLHSPVKSTPTKPLGEVRKSPRKSPVSPGSKDSHPQAVSEAVEQKYPLNIDNLQNYIVYHRKRLLQRDQVEGNTATKITQSDSVEIPLYLQDPPILREHPNDIFNDWLLSPTLVNAIESDNDFFNEEAIIFFQSIPELKLKSLNKTFESSFRLLLRLHDDLRCPQNVHKKFWNAHSSVSVANLISITSRISLLSHARCLLMTIIRVLSGRLSIEDMYSQRKFYETLAKKTMEESLRLERARLSDPQGESHFDDTLANSMNKIRRVARLTISVVQAQERGTLLELADQSMQSTSLDSIDMSKAESGKNMGNNMQIIDEVESPQSVDRTENRKPFSNDGSQQQTYAIPMPPRQLISTRRTSSSPRKATVQIPIAPIAEISADSNSRETKQNRQFNVSTLPNQNREFIKHLLVSYIDAVPWKIGNFVFCGIDYLATLGIVSASSPSKSEAADKATDSQCVNNESSVNQQNSSRIDSNGNNGNETANNKDHTAEDNDEDDGGDKSDCSSLSDVADIEMPTISNDVISEQDSEVVTEQTT